MAKSFEIYGGLVSKSLGRDSLSKSYNEKSLVNSPGTLLASII